MQDLDLDIETTTEWFSNLEDTSYKLIRISDGVANVLQESLGNAIRQCYIDDDLLGERVEQSGLGVEELIAAKLPDQGSTMAGDFGEILAFIYQATEEHPSSLFGPKKWRLKQDRTKPAPYSDVVQFLLPSWPNPTGEDCIICAEVKTKSTNGASSPISSAITDCQKDRSSRLAKTLVWLKERAMYEELGATKVEHLDRFIRATDHPQANRVFRAIAIVCDDLVDDELADVPVEKSADYGLVVISIPNLKDVYESCFGTAKVSRTRKETDER